MRYYLDTEFNGRGGHLISIALVKEVMRSVEADSFYCVMNNFDPQECAPWVRNNVLPVVTKCGGARMGIMPPNRCAERLSKWLSGDPEPIIIADWPDDIKYLTDLLITGSLYWDLEGGPMFALPSLTFKAARVDAYPTTLPDAVQHNAWWDAMALRQFFAENPHV